jgi:hypothetical protein
MTLGEPPFFQGQVLNGSKQAVSFKGALGGEKASAATLGKHL